MIFRVSACFYFRGGLLGQFRAAHRPQDAVTCMAVDAKNLHLFTGDAYGYIKVRCLIGKLSYAAFAGLLYDAA